MKRAAVLLLHSDPEKYITGASIKIGYFKTDSDLLYQDEVSGNLFREVEIIMDLLTTKYLKASICYEDIQRIKELPIPRSALHEAILNAIVPKDYASATPIQISVYDDKLMIWNCGILPYNWSIESLQNKHGSRPYNPDVANLFFRAGEIEAGGRGVERMISVCKEAGCKEPEFRYDGTSLWTVYMFKDTNLKLTDIQKKILDYLASHPQATQTELLNAIKNVTLNGIKYNTTRLQDLGLLKRIGSKRSG